MLFMVQLQQGRTTFGYVSGYSCNALNNSIKDRELKAIKEMLNMSEIRNARLLNLNFEPSPCLL